MNSRTITLFAGPISGLLTYFLLINTSATADNSALAITAAVAIVCVIWWVFEPVPIPVTSLLPLSVFQITGVLTKNEVGQSYGSPLILLLLGGFILSKSMERSGAHLRLALFMVNLFGNTSSKQLVLGFMVTAAMLSMWISNTATTLMLLPVALAVANQARDKQLAVPLMLSVAFAASIGGIGTPIGTPPNLVFMQVYEQQFGNNIGFTEWMSWGIPVVVCMIPVTWLWLTRKLTYSGGFDMPEVGNWSSIEKRVLTIFALTATAWITRKEPFGGWSDWFDLPAANDASVALIAVILMFIIPAGYESEERKGERLLDWDTAKTIPWGILLLFGGGITLAKAFGVSGLSAAIAEQLSDLSTLPILAMIFAICLGVTFLTETTSNTASTVLLMPVLAATAMGSDIDPKLLMIPAAISASCAFMMPVATAPNSIAYASGFFTTRIMAREGFVLNLCGAVIITTLCYLILL
ncbi:MAG: SLC13 family permease [Gammaproteobacteria bacterium]|nr:SLC13 family permease [Gammaproteobacteria bacterium]MBT8135079.1 SLC13 family permease [Gammaproteobacteria bacterium]NNJ49031.1 SLC13/DASS family transporter [Gammaproteobacteria bacterium]